jgi:hypothetical protein
MQPGQQGVFGHITPEGVFFLSATKAEAIGGIGGAEAVVDRLRGELGLEGGDVLPALDRFAVVALGCAAFGLGDQQRQMGLDATGEAVIQGGLQVFHGWIGLIRQQEGTAEVDGGFGVGGVGSRHGVADWMAPRGCNCQVNPVLSRRAQPTRPSGRLGR